MEFIIGYLLVGFFIVSLGAYLHSSAWDCGFLYSLGEAKWIWILGIFFWPLGLDLLLNHKPSRA